MSTQFPSHALKLQVLNTAKAAAHRAAEVIRARRAAHEVTVSFKADRNLVTTCDVESEKIIIEVISSTFPDHLILAEETNQSHPAEVYGKGPVWVIDPIDGTTNFAHGHPHVGISIGWAVDGVAQVGVVLSLFQSELFSAMRGRGAVCNDKPISVSATERIEDALIATGFPYERDHIEMVCARLLRILRRCRDVRRAGAASLDFCWVACGRLDAFYEDGLMPWDGLAGGLIVEEAGGKRGHFPYDSVLQKKTDRFPGDLFMDNVMVATPGVFEELLRELSI